MKGRLRLIRLTRMYQRDARFRRRPTIQQTGYFDFENHEWRMLL